MYTVTIKQIESMTALTREHIGPYLQIGKAFAELETWFAAPGRSNAAMRLIAIYYDNPAVVPPEHLRSRAGVVMADAAMMQTPFDVTQIQGGTYAVLQHKGPYSELGRAYEYLYGQWLQTSGKRAADAPAFEEYLNTPQNAAQVDLLTDIYLLLA